MAARRPRVAQKAPKAAPKRKPAAKPKPAPPQAIPRRRRTPKSLQRLGIALGQESEPDETEHPELPPETVQESLLHIAQDAVIILRRELAKKAELATQNPGRMSMSDCIALLRLTAELGEAAKRKDGAEQADYSRLSPEERVQLAALLLKVDYA